MRVLSSPRLRDGWLPAGLILLALAVFGVLAFRVPGDLRLVSPEIDADLLRAPPSTAAAAGAVDPGKRGRIAVRVSRVRNASGKVAIALYTRGPLTDGRGVLQAQSVPASPGSVSAVFEDVPQGVYAVTVFHDEDGDGRLAVKPGQPPAEGIGASGHSPTRGPPQFEDSRFVLDRDALEVEIPLVYF